MHESYINSSNRLIFLDLKDMENNRIDAYHFIDKILNQLDILSRFEENKIWIISCDTKKHMELRLTSLERYNTTDTQKTGMSCKHQNLFVLCQFIVKASSNKGAPNVGVAAEDGYFYKWDLVYNDWEELLQGSGKS